MDTDSRRKYENQNDFKATQKNQSVELDLCLNSHAMMIMMFSQMLLTI